MTSEMADMSDDPHARLQFTVFALVSASFTNIYITQPVLPVLQNEFSVDLVRVSFSVSAVILGIALSNLPFGLLADRWPIRPIVLAGGVCVAAGGLICALTHVFWIMIAARFLQGIFIPALTTCLAAFLAKNLPTTRLTVVMGSYVSATVIGGLGGRLLGGLIHPPLHWRWAFVSASVLVLMATAMALRGLPRISRPAGRQPPSPGVRDLLTSWDILRIYFCGAGSFAIFSTLFNYLPFRLNAPPFNLSTELTTLLYLVYVVGIFMGPIAGRISNRYGGGNTLLAGSVFTGAALSLIWLPAIPAILAGLLGLCAGFFCIHAAAVGALNIKLSGGQGRANALYVLFYYLGGWIGITVCGVAYKYGGWDTVILICGVLLCIPVWAGFGERRVDRQRQRQTTPSRRV